MQEAEMLYQFVLTREFKQGKLSNGSAVVVKRLAIAIAIGDKLFLHAAISLKSVKHNSIVRFLGYCSISQPKEAREGAKTVIIIVRERLLCFEYLCNGNLQMHLTGMRGDRIQFISLPLLYLLFPLVCLPFFRHF